MKSEVYIQSVIRHLSPTAQRVVVVELGNPWTREAAIRALWSPYPEQAIAQILGQVALMALDHLHTGLVILLHDRTIVFGIELRREGSRTDEVTEHHRQLSAFGFCTWSVKRGA